MNERNEDTEPSKSGLIHANDGTTVMVSLRVMGETRELGAVFISWPREEFYRPHHEIDYRVRLDS